MTAGSERIQEGQKLPHFLAIEPMESLMGKFRLSLVAADGRGQVRSASIVQQSSASAQPPQRSCAHFVSRFLPSILHDAITRADVVQ